MEDLPHSPQRLDDNIAIWAEFEELMHKYGCLSMAQGAPGYAPPPFLRNFMMDAIDQGHNQYTRTFGHPLLVKAISDHYGPKLGRSIDPMSEILVTMGANGALTSYIQAFVNPGDEVVLFEPCFPMYLDHLQFASAKLNTVPLEVGPEKKWVFNPDLLRAALSDKTRLLILNTPHNPTGKCFNREELETITEILQEYPKCRVLSDEVYDFLTFDGEEHVPFASIGDNWTKTISIYSGGKLMNATGWKIGWAIAHPKLLRLGGIINNNIFYCQNTPGQVAMAQALPLTDQVLEPGRLAFTAQARQNFTEVRDYLTNEMREMDLPWDPVPTQSGYFLLADVSKCRDLVPEHYLNTHDYEPESAEGAPVRKVNLFMPGSTTIPLDLAFCRWMAIQNKVSMMPNSFFYHPKSPYISQNYVRLAICKDLQSVKTTCQVLRKIAIRK